MQLDESWIGKIISEHPYVKLLAIPTYNQLANRWECLAQVNEIIAIIEVSIKVKE